MDDGQERRCSFLVSDCDSTSLLETGPEILDHVPTPIGPSGTGKRRTASFLRNGRSGSYVPDTFAEGVRRIALVRHHPHRNGGKAIDHAWGQRSAGR